MEQGEKLEMSYLVPKLKPLKGEFGNVRSLIDCKYDFDNVTGKPIVRFSIVIANIGKGPLYITLGNSQNNNGTVVAPAKQIISAVNGANKEEDVGFFERYEEDDGLGHTHIHWIYRDLASLDLLDGTGAIKKSSRKEGYCVIDSFKFRELPNSPRTGVFSHEGCEQKKEVGISVGWADYYDIMANIIDVEDVPTGEYMLAFKINDTRMIYEIDEPESVPVRIDHENQKACAKLGPNWPC